WRRLFLRALRAVLRTALTAVVHARTVEGAAPRVVAHAWEVFHTTAADQHYRVFLQVVAFAADVADDLETVGEPHLAHFTHRRVPLFRCGGVHARADTALLWASSEGRHLRLVIRRRARFA